MRPKSLSASAAHVFDLCPARYGAEAFSRTPNASGGAADLGTAVHDALEKYCLEGHMVDPDAPLDLLLKMYDDSHDRLFGSDHSRRDEGRGLCEVWHKRTHPIEHEILSAEVKESFPIRVTFQGEQVEVPFNYIWDRCDRLGPEEIDIVDYKTISIPLNAEQMKKKLQVRCYALAGKVKYPEAKRIWVTYDMLRHGEPLGVAFTREECVETYRFLQRLLVRILEADPNDLEENINDECRWCIRKQVCKSLRKHADAGGIHAITDPVEAAERRRKMKNVQGALSEAIKELDTILEQHMRKEDALELELGDTKVIYTAKGKRDLDSERARALVPQEVWDDYGEQSLTLGAFDKLLKDERLDDEQRAALKGLVRKTYGNPFIITKDADE